MDKTQNADITLNARHISTRRPSPTPHPTYWIDRLVIFEKNSKSKKKKKKNPKFFFFFFCCWGWGVTFRVKSSRLLTSPYGFTAFPQSSFFFAKVRKIQWFGAQHTPFFGRKMDLTRSKIVRKSIFFWLFIHFWAFLAKLRKKFEKKNSEVILRSKKREKV